MIMVLTPLLASTAGTPPVIVVIAASGWTPLGWSSTNIVLVVRRVGRALTGPLSRIWWWSSSPIPLCLQLLDHDHSLGPLYSFLLLINAISGYSKHTTAGSCSLPYLPFIQLRIDTLYETTVINVGVTRPPWRVKGGRRVPRWVCSEGLRYGISSWGVCRVV